MDDSSLRWADGALVTLDQRALPHESRELRLGTVDAVIDAIRTLAVRGAPAIGIAGAFGVAVATAAHTGPAGVDLAAVRAEADRLVAARPTAVNLAWAVRRVVALAPAGADAVLAEVLAMLDEDAAVNRAAATHAADLVQRLTPDRPLRLLTHCNTGRLATSAFGTAFGAIRVLAERGAVTEVLVDETRPLLQGARLTTWELAAAGIPHRLLVDSAAAWAMANGLVDAVLVGADRVAADGAVANKIGTYGLALAARHHGIPFVVVAPESTRDSATATGAEIVVEERAAEEVTGFAGTAAAPAGTAAYNPAFDVTPPELVTAVVTERGVVSGTVLGEGSGVVAPFSGTTADQAHPATAVADTVHDGRAGLDAALPGTALAERACAAATVSGPLRDEQARAVAAVSRELHARGWMPGTAGNISVRSGPNAVITGSGLAKGELGPADMVTVRIADGTAIAGTRRPSAETAIHTAVYRTTDAGAVVHVHSPAATVLATRSGPGPLSITGYELIKGLTTGTTLTLPVFANHADVAAIGAEVEHHLRENPGAAPVLAITAHGITTWGADLAQARDRAECLEALCDLVERTGRTHPVDPLEIG
ncbi:S-methyl-5-thioribose-1-phosphate isomerase [Nocardia sp. NPDC057353]|uniref:S-methyl-5-thioribose-1-phosphate isomerase n=1 Tax=Nocardia sp. NPDC057353 TaxID=3346104 RepID=UPI0036380CA9